MGQWAVGAPLIGAKLRRVRVFLLPLPACHKGVYARRSLSSGRPKAGPVGRAMERVGVRGPLHKGGLVESVRCLFAKLRLVETPPHPEFARRARKFRPLHSPSKTGVNALMATGDR